MSDAKPGALSFEEAMRELEGVVQQLDSGDVPLDQSIRLYERGAALRERCEALLKDAEMKVEKIRADADGRADGTEPLDG
ncbi:exodeoxyribonuclease VII small subunit [Hasllibacter halocynthiae]|uniref:Exodeoxyribonuclease 7 small subunit n=1 Tax=Hasllibacter halocynthiae TaxID=595589 RepID=A0A2T0X394_9RHOB|nr:exodeoxyribonuclease VII small subunit [Hasllibacter halocynthiae]PRY93375.1 exodeoxyribonuclease VII small subunit [Hasllibacter halocynthiae]